MDQKPLQEFPPEGGAPRPKKNFFRQLMAAWARLGFNESVVRFGTNFLSLLVIFTVIWLMQFLFHDIVNPQAASAAATSVAPVSESALLPEAISASLEGIARRAIIHTSIPTRPRMDVLQYTVQVGDTIFGIAEKYNLKPTSILFANAIMGDNPNMITPGQVLNILPVDGTYYEWTGAGAETLPGIADYFGVKPDDILSYPGNHLDPDAYSDYETVSFDPGTWLIVPGGTRPFTSWTAPAQLVYLNPDIRVWGVGVCTGITIVQTGYGTFVFPAVNHWLSGTDYRPDVNHFAVDFGGSLGSAIYAVDAGTVIYAGWNDYGYGNMIMLDHGNGWQTLYAHLDSVLVGCGQNVGQGDMIGLMGSTGNSTGPHLHFEMRLDGYFVNPHSIYDIPPR
jgi:murein DD-endopeptidase MepM/ murein hydrolase activator NlpD